MLLGIILVVQGLSVVRREMVARRVDGTICDAPAISYHVVGLTPVRRPRDLRARIYSAPADRPPCSLRHSSKSREKNEGR